MILLTLAGEGGAQRWMRALRRAPSPGADSKSSLSAIAVVNNTSFGNHEAKSQLQ